MDDWGIDGEGYIAAIRAGAIDPFGRTAERRMERQLIADYEATVEHVLKNLRRESLDAAVALLSLYGEIRGYGPVKEEAAMRVKAREAEMRATFDSTEQEKAVAQAL